PRRGHHGDLAHPAVHAGALHGAVDAAADARRHDAPGQHEHLQDPAVCPARRLLRLLLDVHRRRCHAADQRRGPHFRGHYASDPLAAVHRRHDGRGPHRGAPAAVRQHLQKVCPSLPPRHGQHHV
ncbi:hypothetical protein LPJ70_003732, partial [Coemansia sp. RSA 2708]